MKTNLISLLILIILSFLNAEDEEREVIKITLPGDVPMYFTKIDSGSFLMGSPDTLPNDWNGCPKSDGLYSCYDSVHTVTFDYQFYMGTYEVTQAQWKAVMDTNPSQNTSSSQNPVEKISWYDCKEFCNKLNDLDQGTFRLPSESEWEYSCRAGTTTKFYFGDVSDEDCVPEGGPCPELSKYAMWGGQDSLKGTQPVGSFLPNNWGIYDMLGNVYEWCEDHFSSKGYFDAPTDGSAWVDTVDHDRVSRGSWKGYPDPRKYVSYFRSGHAEDTRHGCCGVRIVREIGGDVEGTLNDIQKSRLLKTELSTIIKGQSVKFILSGITSVKHVNIYSINGRKISSISGNFNKNEIIWDSSSKAHSAVKNGTYILEINNQMYFKFSLYR